MNEAKAQDALVPAAEFNVREFARTAAGSHRASLSLEAYSSDPLTGESLLLASYLARREHSTMAHLRNVLVTPTHKDARVTAFLVTWAFEKFWIADALEAVIAAHPGYEPPGEKGAGRVTGLLHRLADRVAPIRESVVANLIGEGVVAVHTATGIVDEWITQPAYERLAELSGHEQLRGTVDRLLRVKRRHAEFFAAQTRDRLTRSQATASLTRRRLARTSWPLGAADEPDEDNRLFFRTVFADRPDLVSEIDARIEAYPGLSGLGLLRRATARHADIAKGGRR